MLKNKKRCISTKIGLQNLYKDCLKMSGTSLIAGT